ncbi:MAG: tRNA-dihydrouridine synthase family protein [Elusimicrobia bacterium]|nr:tRNA-dihydrouridine synthase family protein [Elusimicrobiota bacterium]
MGLRLGTLSLPSAVLQSPMADCSDLAFRLVSRRRGLGFAFTEMVSAQSLLRRGRKTLDLLKTVPEDRPLGAQLLGKDPSRLAAAAARLADLGCDLIDLNFGCPVKKVVSNGEGAALLKDPDLAERIFAAVRRAVKVPLTVKTRKGFSDASGAEAVELARRAEAQGLDAVTIHGRTQKQMYGGSSDHGAVALVRRAVSIPVIGNGDVRVPQDAVRLREESGCHGVMIGRGGLGNPWLYRRAELAWEGKDRDDREPDRDARRAALLEHFDLEVEHCGERLAALNFRRIGAWYTSGLPGAKAFRTGVYATMDVKLIRRMIEDFFGAAPADSVRTESVDKSS